MTAQHQRSSIKAQRTRTLGNLAKGGALYWQSRQIGNVSTLTSNPVLLPHRYDPQHDAIHFRHTPRAAHGAATFLTDKCLGEAKPTIIPRTAALAQAGTPAPLRFVLHCAFCCSTLLVRAFNAPGLAMGLKEPMILNDLVGWQLRGACSPQLAQAMEASLALLARPFGPGESVVVKPSNVANALIAGMLQLRPQARAPPLHAPLPIYLGSIARKGLDGRLWVRDLLVKQIAQGLHDFGFGAEAYLTQSDLQVAAMGWLAQHRLFSRLAERLGDRVRTLNSDLVTAQPAEVMTALGSHFGINLDVPAVIASPAFTRHSKHGTSFNAETREQERSAEAAHADEIGKVTIWAEKVAESQGMAMALPSPLIR
jgi:hypothetical protein